MQSLSKYDSPQMSKRTVAIIALIVLALILAIGKDKFFHREPPEGFIELGTPYSEAKPRILAMYPNATVNEELTRVSHGAIKVEVNDYEGVKGQTASIHYIFGKDTQELDLEYYWISEPKVSHRSVYNKWRKAVIGQYGKPEIEFVTFSQVSGSEWVQGFWERNGAEISMSCYERSEENKDEDQQLFLSYTTRNDMKLTYEEKQEYKKYEKKGWVAVAAHRLLPFM